MHALRAFHGFSSVFFSTLKVVTRFIVSSHSGVYFASQFSLIFVALLKQFFAFENIILNVKTLGTVNWLINYLFYLRYLKFPRVSDSDVHVRITPRW